MIAPKKFHTTAAWWLKVWKKVEPLHTEWKVDGPLPGAEGGAKFMDDKTYDAQMSRKGECSNCPGHISWTDPSQLDWEGFEESEETCLATVNFYFKDGTGSEILPGKSWPTNCSIPIWTLQPATKPKGQEGHCRLLFSGLVRAFWYAVYLLLQEEPKEFNLEWFNKKTGFRTLARTVLFNYYYLPCLLYTSPSPRDPKISRMPSSA